MILQNLARFAEYPIRQSAYNIADCVTLWGGHKLEWSLNKYVGEAEFDNYNGVPKGYSHPYSWREPLKPGGLASHITADGAIADALLANGLGCEATITASGGISDAALQMIVALVATIAGSGYITDAQLTSPMSMDATITASGGIESADLGAIINMVATIAGSGSVLANLIGNALMSAHIYVNEGAADVDQIVDGVWNATASDYNEAGTMGQKLNSAGSAGDPWVTELPGTYAGQQAGNIIGTLLLRLVKFLALK